MTKVCINKDCIHKREPQDISNFYKHGQYSDGHFQQCKDCMKKTRHENFETLDKKLHSMFMGPNFGKRKGE